MIIKEFLPNPAGNDKEGEYIKLFNDGGNAVSLVGWSVKDASGKTYQLSGILEAGRELILPYSKTKIALNNNGEQVLLYDAAGNLADELSYIGKAEEGQIIAKSEKGKATSELTANEIPNNLIANNSITGGVIFTAILVAAILAALSLYIILQLEKRLNIKLW